MKKTLVIVTLLAAAALAQQFQLSYAGLTEGRSVRGFKTAAVYLDDAEHPIGARFLHQRSGFTLDLLQIQSVPQAFIWVTTYPSSNMGEPHTQEHLLLGKGDIGRMLGSRTSMSLIDFTAFTMQWRTCYSFYASAGSEVFYRGFESMMDALLHPDYSDEEVRREVRNFGVSVNPKDGSLRLEEKGSVYNEMSTSMDQANYLLFRAAQLADYGPEHPLSFSSGGLPPALRVIQPSDIRRFHAQHYFLANMGAIVSLPKEIPLDAALARLDAGLNRLEPVKPTRTVVTENQLPPALPAPAGRIEYVEYPFRNEQQPGSVFLLWPPDRKLSYRDNILLSLFLETAAGGPGTNLYKRLIDSKTREADFGPNGVGGFVGDDLGNPAYVTFQNMPVSRMNDRDLGSLRAKVLDEFARIAAWPDGSAELAAFHEQLKSRILQQRRSLAKFVDSPPGFGFRNGNSAWLTNLYELNKEPGFRKSLTAKNDLDAIEKLVSGGRNIWRDYLAQWKITGVTPYIEAAKPNPALVVRQQQEREERATAEAARLKEKYGAADEQEAIRRYRAEYDAATAVIDEAGRKLTPPRFIDTPPMTLDDQLDYKATRLANGVPMVASTFDSMTSGTTGIALRLDGVGEDRLVYVSLLPQLLRGVGVIENGKPLSYDEMTERLRKEVLSLTASFSANEVTGRYELAVRGSGNNLPETLRAIEWMRLILLHPNWRPDNLPRIRDLVDQNLSQLRSTTQAPEESWVNPVAGSYRKQTNPLHLAIQSFMTRAHNVWRLKWMLKGGGTDAVYAFLADLAKTDGSRVERKSLLASVKDGKHPGLAALTPAERSLAADAARDLDTILADIPDSSLAQDWKYLCNRLGADLRAGPERTLAALDEVRSSILTSNGARMLLIASTATQQALNPAIQGLAGSLQNTPAKKAVYSAARRIDQRLADRDPQAVAPLFVGLLNASSQGGVFLHNAPFVSYRDTSRDKLLDYLAANLYAGGGAHSIFSKTIGAGLAYSNGIVVAPANGLLGYYAERTPELPQTLKFVIDELKKAQFDAALAEYAIAGAFRGTRSAQAYEARGAAMADNLADGLSPEVVSRFHQAILDLRKAPDLGTELYRRMNPVYSNVLPGMAGPAKDVPGATYFVIGPEKQFVAYEEYLKKTQGPDARLHRLYPRDFWLTVE